MGPANVMNEYIPNTPHAHADPRTITAKEIAQQAQQYIGRARRQYNRTRGLEDDEEFGADEMPPERIRYWLRDGMKREEPTGGHRW